MKILKTSVSLFYYNGLPVGKIFFKFLKMCDSDQRRSQTLLPGGQTATKCEFIYFILLILKDFFIFYISISVVNRDKLARLWTRIARLSDHPRKWFNTLWKGLALGISKSIKRLPWVVWELSNSRSKSSEFIAIYNNNGNIENKKIFQNYQYKINEFTLGGSLPTWKQGLWSSLITVTHFKEFEENFTHWQSVIIKQ